MRWTGVCGQVVMAGWIIGLNSLVLDTLIRLKGRNGSRDATDVLLASLSVTDILSGVFILHTCIYSLSKYQVDKYTCKADRVLDLSMMACNKTIPTCKGNI